MTVTSHVSISCYTDAVLLAVTITYITRGILTNSPKRVSDVCVIELALYSVSK